MKKVIVNASNSSRVSPRKEAEEVLSKLKEAFDLIETMSDEACAYVPEHVMDDIQIAIHEIHFELHGN